MENRTLYGPGDRVRIGRDCVRVRSRFLDGVDVRDRATWRRRSRASPYLRSGGASERAWDGSGR